MTVVNVLTMWGGWGGGGGAGGGCDDMSNV